MDKTHDRDDCSCSRLPRRRRILDYVAVISLVLSTALQSGCSTTRRRPLDSILPPPPADQQESRGRSIVGYTTTDGRYHGYRGRIETAGVDSVRLIQSSGAGSAAPENGVAQPTARVLDRREIQTVFMKGTSGGGALVIVAGLSTAFVVMLVYGIARGAAATSH